MRNFYILLLLLPMARLFGQTPVQTACGVPATACPVRDSITIGTFDSFNSSIFRGAEVSGSRRQFLVTRRELLEQGFRNGIITELAVQLASNRPNKFRAFSVRVGCVDSNVTSLNQFYPTPTQVYAVDSIDPQRGWVRFPFSGNGYAWNGKSGLIIETCFTNPLANNTVDDSLRGSSSAGLVWIVNVTDGSVPCASTTGQFTFAFRPIFRFGLCKAGSIAAVPTLVQPKAVLHPNPTSGAFEVFGLSFPYQVEVRDLQGHAVLRRTVNRAEEARLSISGRGMYLVHTQAGSLQQHFKVEVME